MGSGGGGDIVIGDPENGRGRGGGEKKRFDCGVNVGKRAVVVAGQKYGAKREEDKPITCHITEPDRYARVCVCIFDRVLPGGGGWHVLPLPLF